MPDFNPVQLEAFVRQRAPQIAKDILAAAQKARNEAELVSAVEKLLEKFADNFDVQLNPYKERTLINGRADAVYNRFVIEYEPPKSLQKSNTYRANKHAIEQVQQYMGGLERLDRHKKERLAGAVLDGGFFIFVRYRDDHWHIDDPQPVSAHSTETFLRYLLSLSTELALTPENLVRDFGENSNTARQVVPALYQIICCTDNPKAKVLFQQWQRQFREVSGYDPDSGQLDAAELARLYAVKEKKPDIEHLFFSIHTYYAAFIKLLALQVVHYYLMPKIGSGLAAAANYPGDELRSWLSRLEAGGLFKELDFRNFLEGDFFGWYLDAWDESIEAAMRRLVGDLANYSLVTLDVDPEETRDLLKQLYQNLMPKKLRHALGEYYTPDWLAERLLNQLGYDGNPSKRILDPACGSGTFLVLAVKRAREYIEEKMLPPAQALEQILNNIVGFDLNPLAVISARTNYLLALGDLLEYRHGDITLPVYLCDSILTPTSGADLFSQHTYSFNTAVGKFSVPKSLVQAQYIDQLADLLEESVHIGLSERQFRDRVLHTFPLREPQDELDIGVLVNMYNTLLELEKKGVNGIWARIIKNAFAPLFQAKFDYVMGNPPWVNWESLPEDYRRETLPLWHYHGMIPPGGWKSFMGHSKMDIAMLMTYVTLENYTKDNGRLGFVITQTVFKTGGAGQGFRKFTLGNKITFAILSVDDMSNLKPFEGASNRTSIIIIQKNRITKYPIKSYNMWYKPDGGSTIPENTSLEEISSQKIATYRNFYGQPVNHSELSSAWITGKSYALNAISKILGSSEYRAHAGAYTGGANGVYFLNIIDQTPDGLLVVNNITDGARRAVEDVQTVLEAELIFPLLRGRDVTRWQAIPQAHILIPRRVEFREKAVPEDVMTVSYPKTYAYLNHFRRTLDQRRDSVLMRSRESIPFYSIGAVNDYTFAPYKVIWREQAAGLTVAVIGQIDTKSIVPDHKLMLVDFQNENEAHFLCGILNSSPAQYVVLSYGITIQIDTHILENIRVPRFNPSDLVHQQISRKSLQAHNATIAGDINQVHMIEAELDQLTAHLWGLTDDELKEIQESLEELG